MNAKPPLSLLAAGLVLLFGSGANGAMAQDFVVDDIVVSTREVSTMDTEFCDDPPTLAWQSRENELWVISVDADGTWTPKDGKQELVDVGLTPIAKTRQGGEWALAFDGARLAYTKDDGQIPSVYQARRKEGSWEPEFVPGTENCKLLTCSSEPGDSEPRVLFWELSQRNKARLGWRALEPPYAGEIVDIKELEDPRWVFGMRSIGLVDGKDQISLYDIDSRQLLQITKDRGKKTFPLIWKKGSSPVLVQLVAVVDGKSLAVYASSGGRFVQTDKVKPPVKYPNIYRPEYFEFEGRSFLHFLATNSKSSRDQNQKDSKSEVWIVEVTAAGKLENFRRVNDSAVTHIKDTESVVASGTAYVYYAEILSDGTRLIHRCATGL